VSQSPDVRRGRDPVSQTPKRIEAQAAGEQSPAALGLRAIHLTGELVSREGTAPAFRDARPNSVRPGRTRSAGA